MSVHEEVAGDPTGGLSQPGSSSQPAARRPSALVAHWQAFWAAVQFLTRLPVPARFLAVDHEAAPLERATIYFPLVGSLIGLATGTSIWLAAHAWPLWLAVLLGLAAEALLTGCLHEDGLADCCDALGGGRTRADVLRILDDSRLGTYGVLALALALLLRAGSLVSLEASLLLPSVVASATLGRWAMVVAMAWLAPLADRPSLTRLAGRQTVRVQAFWSGLLALGGSLPLAILWPARFGASVVATMIITTWFVYYLRRRIGGMTGDGAGAICYASQVAVLLCCCAFAGHGAAN
ncbi:MAG TPA: adenosylcobinamide-GDP ribazoletransferase [Pirellulales bacterium]|jgi:adenosylcobinamide-GDP ribazoletransferase|nr:adenosylcobinamide-GDP ribazoletransferase [Pirellulales bacterium]